MSSKKKSSKKSCGPTNLVTDKVHLQYKPPTGEPQLLIVEMKNCISKPVAFKIVTNRLNYYSATPGKGIIANGTKKIEFQMSKSSYTMEEYERDRTGHEFHILALVWPEKLGDFKNDEWKQLQQTKGDELQKIVLDISFKGSQAASAKIPLEVTSGPELIRIEPDSLIVTIDLKKVHLFTLQNVTEKSSVAYKFVTNKPNFYVVNPSKGLLTPGNTATSVIEVNKKVPLKDLKADKEDHQFVLIAREWFGPYEPSQFDQLILKTKKTELQKFCIDVTLELELDLIKASPTTLSFTQPKQMQQVVSVNLVNRSSNPVAFFIDASDPDLYKYYTVIPYQGIIPIKARCLANFALKPNIRMEHLPSDDQGFKLVAFNCKEYSQTMPDSLLKEKKQKREGETQVIKFDINFDKREEVPLWAPPVMMPGFAPMGMNPQMMGMGMNPQMAMMGMVPPVQIMPQMSMVPGMPMMNAQPGIYPMMTPGAKKSTKAKKDDDRSEKSDSSRSEDSSKSEKSSKKSGPKSKKRGKVVLAI